jgi:hypothetical protein
MCALLQRSKQHPNSISGPFVFTCRSNVGRSEDILLWEIDGEERSLCLVLLDRNRNRLSVNGDEHSAPHQGWIKAGTDFLAYFLLGENAYGLNVNVIKDREEDPRFV